MGKECSDASALFRLNTGLQREGNWKQKTCPASAPVKDIELRFIHQKLTSQGLVGQISPNPHPTSTSVLVFDQVLEEGTESSW